jgi:hypothetical protein
MFITKEREPESNCSMNIFIKSSMNLYFRFKLARSVFWDGARVSSSLGIGL